jgi:hypothetical protein
VCRGSFKIDNTSNCVQVTAPRGHHQSKQASGENKAKQTTVTSKTRLSQALVSHRRVRGTTWGGMTRLTSNDDNHSVDMLLTQEEYSSGDEDEKNGDAEFWGPSNNEHRSTLMANSRTTATSRAASPSLPPQASTTATNSTGKTAFQHQWSTTPLPSMTTAAATACHNAETAASPERSPASQTLHALSSQSNANDLFYDMTQLEKDATSVKLQLKEGKGSGWTENSPATSNDKKLHHSENPYRKPAVGLTDKDPQGLQPHSLQQGATQLPQKDRQGLPPHPGSRKQQPPRLKVPPLRKEQPKPLQQEQCRVKDKKDYTLGDFEIFHVIVDKGGPLGMTVSVEPPPSDFITRASAKYCQVKAVEPKSLGYTFGLREGDWVLADASGMYLAEYNNVVATARSSERPVNFYVARKKESNPLLQETEQVVNHHDFQSPVPVDRSYAHTYQKPATAMQLSTVNQTGAYKSTGNANQELPRPSKGSLPKRKSNEISSDQEDEVEIVLPNNDKVVPFCKLCNAPKAKKKTNGAHHALCPKNEHFHYSNADNILHDMISGVNLSCSVCVRAYQLGKAPSKGNTHVESCIYRRVTLPPTKAAKKKTTTRGSDSSAHGRKQAEAKRRSKQINNPGTSKTKTKRDATAGPSPRYCIGGNGQPRPDTSKPKSQPNQQTALSERGILTGRFISRGSSIQPQGNEINLSQPNIGSMQSKRATTQSKRATSTGTGQSASAVTSARGSKGIGSRRPLQAIPVSAIQHATPQRTVSPPIYFLENANNGAGSTLAVPAFQGPPVRGRDNSKSTFVLAASNDPSADRMQIVPQTSTVQFCSRAAMHATTATSNQGNDHISATSATQNTRTHGELHSMTKNDHLKSRTTAVTVTRDAPSDALSHVAPPTFAAEAPSLSERNQEHDPFVPCKTKWIPIANPWGPHDSLFSDEIVLTTARGIGHHEELLPSELYSRNPFSSSSDYRTTHHTPDEGFHFIRLQRDPMAMRSWGFSVRRHENGGACLVESVDLMSPAESAVSFVKPTHLLICVPHLLVAHGPHCSCSWGCQHAGRLQRYTLAT